MREFDYTGLQLAKAQGNFFVESLQRYSGSSAIFIRKFMYLNESKQIDDYLVFDSARIVEELSDARLDLGKDKYDKDVIYWIGYIYRYWSYVYEISSKRIYRTINAEEMSKLYYVYHTMDPKKAIDTILETKGISYEMSFEAQYELFKRIRGVNF